MSRNYKQYFTELEIANESRFDHFRAAAAESLREQQALERSPQIPFEAYLAQYFE